MTSYLTEIRIYMIRRIVTHTSPQLSNNSLLTEVQCYYAISTSDYRNVCYIFALYISNDVYYLVGYNAKIASLYIHYEFMITILIVILFNYIIYL